MWRADHEFFDVVNCAADFFAGVEDVKRVEDVFRFCKQLKHFWAEHRAKERRAYNAISVLARYRTFVFGDKSIHLWGQLHDRTPMFRPPEVDKGDDVEVCITDVPRYCVHNVVLSKERV